MYGLTKRQREYANLISRAYYDLFSRNEKPTPREIEHWVKINCNEN